MDRFEYKVLALKQAGFSGVCWFHGDDNLGKDLESTTLNQFGAEGWELCGIMPIESGISGKIILKRMLTD